MMLGCFNYSEKHKLDLCHELTLKMLKGAIFLDFINCVELEIYDCFNVTKRSVIEYMCSPRERGFSHTFV